MATQTDSTRDPYKLTPEQQELFNRFMMIVLGIGIGWLLFADKEGYATNIFTEVLGVAGTFFVLDYWVRRRDERKKVEELKTRLVHEAGSRVNAIAIQAVQALRHQRWLTVDDKEPLLKRANLTEANLEEANLVRADLEGANFTVANLRGARLHWANLKEALLFGADLNRASLQGADLHDASLTSANLQGADLVRAKLRGANLTNANLRLAHLSDAEYSTETILPDGSQWRLGTEMERFMNPNHPNFWPYPNSLKTDND